MFDTDILFSVSVTVTALRESQAADFTGVWLGSNVRAHMVQHIAQLGEGLGADSAPKLLVHPPGLLIQVLHFFVPLSFRDLASD